jgi:hypothetical protein
MPCLLLNRILKNSYYGKNVWFFSNCWRRGFKDSRGQGFQGLFSKDFISAFNLLSISAMALLSVPNSPFSIKAKSPANNQGIDTTDLLICEVRPHLSSFGNFAVIL